uniref:Tetratricopeptide repeat containing protein n=1 Tax=uncultured bacterium SA343_p TaxID=1552128 RepID=A0A0K0LBF1_9BACT|nr:tetratricopeptide repeat containing protein [uncultured bacterium SA343_p]
MAGQNLRKALELQPGLLQAQQGLVALAMADKKPAEALVQTRNMQKQQPKAVAGYMLEGDVHAVAKAWDKAAQTYRAGLKEIPDSVDLAVRLHSALLSMGAKADAARWSAEWMRTHPKNAAFPFYLGDRALASTDLQEARQQFARVVELEPENAAAFNNLAWVKARLKQPGALVDAEKANTLAPNEPAFMDTWAMLLSEAGQHEKAIDLQKKALALQPQAALLKLNMAKIYLQAGQKDAARPLLDEIQALGDKFPGKDEAARLRSAL